MLKQRLRGQVEELAEKNGVYVENDRLHMVSRESVSVFNLRSRTVDLTHPERARKLKDLRDPGGGTGGEERGVRRERPAAHGLARAVAGGRGRGCHRGAHNP